MKKTLIALALTALPVAAMADVTLYGQIKGGVALEQTRLKTSEGTAKLNNGGSSTDTMVRDFGSRIGFKGEEDLGNGLKTIWQVEQTVSLGGNTKTGWSNRETFLGLEGNFGKVRVGNLKNVFDENSSIDPWEYDSANALGLGIFTRTEKRVAPSIKYNTPDFAGFTGSLQYRTKANSDQTRADGSGKGSEEVYVGLNYENSGFFAKYGFGQKQKSYANVKGEAKNGQLHRLEGGYDANNLFVSAAYQYGNGWDNAASYLSQDLFGLSKDDVTALENTAAGKVGLKTKEAVVTASYTMGAVTPRISYAHGWDLKAVGGDKLGNTKYDQVVIGADYALSKRTTALVSAGWLQHGAGYSGTNEDFKNKYTQKALGVGMKHVF